MHEKDSKRELLGKYSDHLLFVHEHLWSMPKSLMKTSPHSCFQIVETAKEEILKMSFFLPSFGWINRPGDGETGTKSRVHRVRLRGAAGRELQVFSE